MLATAPSLFTQICANLSGAGLVDAHSRVVLEKPLGTDLASARAINTDVARYFEEQQIYRIDHYLDKETVQNLMVLHFGNAIFEPLWRAPYIKSVQITVAESVGVGSRAGFYDGAGAMRDMVQNHLLQLLCIVAMEQPISLGADEVREPKNFRRFFFSWASVMASTALSMAAVEASLRHFKKAATVMSGAPTLR